MKVADVLVELSVREARQRSAGLVVDNKLIRVSLLPVRAAVVSCRLLFLPEVLR